MVKYSHLCKNFPQFVVIHTVKDFSVVNEAESEEELKKLLMKVKEESEKTGLKLNIQKANIMASGPITSWHKGGVIYISEVIDIFPGNLDSSLCFIQHGSLHDLLCIKVKLAW